jgi:D-alanine-D-alanine ligase|tara:strand:+ start:312 stop:1253 length:942 start_codon:yes stop_codon:yes gene_type:complete
MVKQKNVLVVQGGVSSEREISLRSGKACIRALKKLKHKVITFDPAKESLNKIKRYKNKVDLIFNALHGRDGEDGIVQSYFEYFKIPYTHSGIISSMNAMDKIISKKIFNKNNLLTPIYISLNSVNYKKKLKRKIFLKKLNFNYPMVVKPSNEGSSIGVEICKTFDQLKSSVFKLIKNYKTLIVEEYIAGQEIQVAVINGKALGAIELQPKRKFYDYKAKYSKNAFTRHIMPASINKKNYKKVLMLGKKAHQLLKCRGVTRSDFKLYKNRFYLLEINTQPGMTNLSLVPEIAKYAGTSFKELIRKIIDDATINR